MYYWSHRLLLFEQRCKFSKYNLGTIRFSSVVCQASFSETITGLYISLNMQQLEYWTENKYFVVPD